MSEAGKRSWNAKLVVGAIFLVTSAIVFIGSFQRARLGLHPTDIYTYRNGFAFLAAGAVLIVWGIVRRKMSSHPHRDGDGDAARD